MSGDMRYDERRQMVDGWRQVRWRVETGEVTSEDRWGEEWRQMRWRVETSVWKRVICITKCKWILVLCESFPNQFRPVLEVILDSERNCESNLEVLFPVLVEIDAMMSRGSWDDECRLVRWRVETGEVTSRNMWDILWWRAETDVWMNGDRYKIFYVNNW